MKIACVLQLHEGDVIENQLQPRLSRDKLSPVRFHANRLASMAEIPSEHAGGARVDFGESVCVLSFVVLAEILNEGVCVACHRNACA